MPFPSTELFKKKKKTPRDSLTLSQKLLTSPFISKAIDFISAGQTLPEAEQYAKRQKEGITETIKAYGQTLFPHAVKREEETFKPKHILSALENVGRVPTAIQTAVVPKPGLTRAESAMQGLIRPDLTPPGYLGGETRKLFPPDRPDQGLFTPANITAALAGTAGDIASYELGLGILPKRIAGFAKSLKTRGAFRSGEELVDTVTRNIITKRSPKVVAKGKALTTEMNKLRPKVRKAILGSVKEKEITRPGVFDILEKAQTPKKLASDWVKKVKKVLSSERGAKEIITPKDLAKAVKELPLLSTTEEALAFGSKATPLMVKALKQASINQDAITDKLQNIEKPTDQQLQQGMDEAVKGQLLSEAIEASEEKVKTGIPITLSYGKNLEKAEYMGARFAQDIEPKGEYIIEAKFENVPKGWEKGIITFKNPLVVEHISPGQGGWKTKLSKQYGNKKGQALTDAVKEAGYDGIITVKSDIGEISEIVNLSGVKKQIKKEQKGVKGFEGGTPALEAIKRGEALTKAKQTETLEDVDDRLDAIRNQIGDLEAGAALGEPDDIKKLEELNIEYDKLMKKSTEFEKPPVKTIIDVTPKIPIEPPAKPPVAEGVPDESKKPIDKTKIKLLKGREAKLDSQRVSIEKQMFLIEKEKKILKKNNKSTKIVDDKLQKLSKSLESVHFQLGDVRDLTKKEVEREKVELKGKEITGIEKSSERKGFVAGKEEAKIKIRKVITAQKGRKELSTEVKRLIKNIQTKPTKDLPIEYKDAIEDIKSNIDFEKVRLSNILKREKAVKLLDEDAQAAAKELSAINAEDMTLADLQEVEDIVSQLYHSGVHEHRFLSNEIKIAHDKAIIQASKQLKPKKPGKEVLPLEKILKEESPLSRKKRTAKQYLYADRRPEAIFEELDNYKTGGVFTEVAWNPTIEGTAKYYDALDKATKDIAAITDPIKGEIFLKMFKTGKDWINVGSKTIIIPDIKTKITRSDAMAVYAHSQNETNTAHLKAMGFTDDQIDNVIGQLSQDEKKVVDDVIDYLTKELFPLVDKTNIALKGVHLNAVDRYFPITGLQDLGSTEAVKLDLRMREDYRRKGMVSSFAKEREVKDSTTKGFKRLDFFSTLYNHIKNVSYYNNMAVPIRDASKLLFNPTVRNSIKERHAPGLNIIISRWIDSIKINQIPGATTPIMNFIDTIGKNAVTFFVSGNLSTATKQTASFSQGAHFVGEINAASGLLQVTLNPLGILKFASNRSTLIRERAKGLNIERDYIEMLEGKGAAGKFGVKNTNAAKKLKDIYGSAKTISMIPLRIMDMTTVLSIWKGAYDSKIAIGVDSKDAVKWADKAIRRTQPMSGIINLPDNFRAGTMLRQLTRLRNQPSENMNLLYDTVKRFAESDKKGEDIKKFGSNLIWFYIAPAVMFGLLSRKRWYRDKKEFAHDIVNYGIGGFTGMGGLFNAVAAPYFSSDLYNSWLDKIKDIQQGRGKKARQKAIVGTVGITFGVPLGGQASKLWFGEDIKQKLFGGESQFTRLRYEYKSALQLTDKKERLAKIKEINRKTKKKGLSVSKVAKDGKSWLRNDLRDKYKIEGNIDDIENLRIIRKMPKDERSMLIRTYAASTQEKLRDKL